MRYKGYDNPEIGALVGQVVDGYILSDDRQTLTLIRQDGLLTPIVLEVDADCCSYTWVESLDNPTALHGKIVAAEEIGMPDLGDVPTAHKTCVECVKYYGLKIVTERGHCVIDYRNDSNGYYGGSIKIVDL